jgi:hypothetical protein
MEYFEAPNRYITLPGMFGIRHIPSLFLAGGITGCPDWQENIVHLLKDTNARIFNPRRANFPIHDPSAAKNQIAWEYYYLANCDHISFWFPKESLCPIVLFELGRWSAQHGKFIYVGMNPEYQRRQDVEIQMHMERTTLDIVYTLHDLASQIIEGLNRAS